MGWSESLPLAQVAMSEDKLAQSGVCQSELPSNPFPVYAVLLTHLCSSRFGSPSRPQIHNGVLHTVKLHLPLLLMRILCQPLRLTRSDDAGCSARGNDSAGLRCLLRATVARIFRPGATLAVQDQRPPGVACSCV
jgi:hypothetical protein